MSDRLHRGVGHAVVGQGANGELPQLGPAAIKVVAELAAQRAGAGGVVRARARVLYENLALVIERLPVSSQQHQLCTT